MTAPVYLLLGVALVAVAGYALLRKPLRRYLQMRGTRVVACPDDRQAAVVTVDARHAALTTAAGHPHLRLDSCSRWPVTGGCGQDCLSQIERQPAECLLRTQIGRWYAGASCAICGTSLGTEEWTERKPALRAPGGETLEWKAVPPETVFQVMETHAPVCWNCHVAETFRRQHPELVLDNPFTTSPDR
jgi:hypothetical protein